MTFINYFKGLNPNFTPVADTNDSSFDIYYAINDFFNSQSVSTHKDVCKILFNQLRGKKTVEFPTILPPDHFDENIIFDSLYYLLYWETNSLCVLADVPPSGWKDINKDLKNPPVVVNTKPPFEKKNNNSSFTTVLNLFNNSIYDKNNVYRFQDYGNFLFFNGDDELSKSMIDPIAFTRGELSELYGYKMYGTKMNTLQDYYKGLNATKVLFHYGRNPIPDNEGYSFEKRYRRSNGTKKQYSTDFNLDFINDYFIIKDLLSKPENTAYLSNSGVFSVEQKSDSKVLFESFNLQTFQKNTVRLFFKNNAELKTELKFDFTGTSKQRFLSPNGCFFIELFAPIERISIYFNIYNSSIMVSLYQDNKDTLFKVYKKYEDFCVKNKFFMNFNKSSCFNPELSLQDFCIQEQISDQVKQTIKENPLAYPNILCLTKSCYSSPYNEEGIASPVRTKIQSSCDGQTISFCINNFDSKDSRYRNVTFKNTCGDDCPDGLKKVKGVCVPIPPKPTSLPESTSIYLYIAISVFVFLVVVFCIVCFVLFRKKNRKNTTISKTQSVK
jgi:hypothetical protein